MQLDLSVVLTRFLFFVRLQKEQTEEVSITFSPSFSIIRVRKRECLITHNRSKHMDENLQSESEVSEEK
jgi:hypothetical protein